MKRRNAVSLLPRLREYWLMYAIGSVVYTTVELGFRGYTHVSMVILGGLCGMVLHRINKKARSYPLILRALAGAAFITALELAVGCVVNLTFHLQVWDYSEEPLNFLGQICPLFSFAWFLLCFPAFRISSLVSRYLLPCLRGGLFFRREAHERTRHVKEKIIR